MTRRSKGLLRASAALALAALAGIGLYHLFAPASKSAPTVLDGTYTYVDNEALLVRIAGSWASADGRFVLTIQPDGWITVALDGESVLEDTLQFCYLQPGDVASTEFDLHTWALTGPDGACLGTIASLRHEEAGGGTIQMELESEDGCLATIAFVKTASAGRPW